jgi:hypothetical protein
VFTYKIFYFGGALFLLLSMAAGLSLFLDAIRAVTLPPDSLNTLWGSS